MSTGTKHTVTAFDDDMDEIRGMIAEMGARAETAVINAMKALNDNDKELATITRAEDKIIDQLETDVEKLVVRTIALRAPMADDLRELVAALKMSAVIERIGDYAKNIAKRVGLLETKDFLTTNDQLRRMGEIVIEMMGTLAVLSTLRSWRQTSIPDRFSSIQSSNTRSGVRSRAIINASSPSPVWRTSNSSRSKCQRTSSASAASSSTRSS